MGAGAGFGLLATGKQFCVLDSPFCAQRIVELFAAAAAKL
jgi:hypothetical protein